MLSTLRSLRRARVCDEDSSQYAPRGGGVSSRRHKFPPSLPSLLDDSLQDKERPQPLEFDELAGNRAFETRAFPIELFSSRAPSPRMRLDEESASLATHLSLSVSLLFYLLNNFEADDGNVQTRGGKTRVAVVGRIFPPPEFGKCIFSRARDRRAACVRVRAREYRVCIERR